MQKSINERIKSVYENSGIRSIRAFAAKVGVAQTSLNDIIKKGAIPKTDTLEKILIAEPHISSDWLLTGKGEMIKSARPVNEIKYMSVPFVPIHARAGYLTGYGDSEYLDELPTIPVIVDKNYKGKYRVFEVEGDSMDDESRNALYDGDKILCRDVRPDLWTSKLHIRDWYFVVVSKTEGIIVKQITDHNVETGDIVCHSLNPIFSDLKLNLNDVTELYNVIKIVDRNARI
ncbi:MAG: hypothetical protein LBL58_17415 [Tannerellaceae bacterium]|jgi:hypothetical protein|nr:hypothetical protein [Tannerellaceae bacterium]